MAGTSRSLSQLPLLGREPIWKFTEPRKGKSYFQPPSLLSHTLRRRSHCADSLPLVPLLPFIRILLQFEVGGLDLFRDFVYSPSGGVERSISWVVVRQFMTQILHVPNPLLTQSQRFAFPEESLEIWKKCWSLTGSSTATIATLPDFISLSV